MQWNDKFLNSSSMMMVTLKKVVTGVWFHRLAGCHRVTYDDSLLVDYSHPLRPPGGLWKLASSAGWATRQVQTWSRRCNRTCATCHLATWALHKHQHRRQFFWAWVFLPNPILDRYNDDGFLLSSAWVNSTSDSNEHIINLACKLLSMLNAQCPM